jgi:hypothetical protein
VLEAANMLVDADGAAAAARSSRTAGDLATRALMYLDDSSGTVGDALQAAAIFPFVCCAFTLALTPPARRAACTSDVFSGCS